MENLLSLAVVLSALALACQPVASTGSGSPAPVRRSAGGLIGPDDAAGLGIKEARRMSLAGIPESPTYSSVRYSADPAKIGVAVQLWRPGSAADAKARYLSDLGSYPSARVADELGERSFRSVREDWQTVHWLSGDAVLSLTCGLEACSPGVVPSGPDPSGALRWDRALLLASAVERRLREVSER